MQATATQAMIPKARGMYAKRISPAEYEEMMRRRTVPELAALLKRHPYFAGSLATLSTTDPHRRQIEELLSMDIFQKYESLVKYDFSDGGFSGIYLAECELREVLKALHLISVGLVGAYLKQIPGYLVGKTRIDLFALGRARSLKEVMEVAGHSIYQRALRARWLADPYLQDFPATEAALLRAYYAMVFESIDRDLRGRDAESTSVLFRQEAEVYNLELLLRLKAFFPGIYSPDEIDRLLMPYSYRVPKKRLEAMIHADGPETVVQLLRQSGFLTVEASEDIALAGGQRIYVFARRSLHLTASPVAALAAFLSLAKLERENVVNVVEGVRYNLPPEKIRSMLHT